MIVDEPGGERLSRQTFSFRGRSDLRNLSVLDRYTDAAPRAMHVEDEIRDQGTPHDECREAKRPGAKPLLALPEA